ncbi:MAG: FkbM family methyltransferase [Flavobacteriales bacterium]|nr:FkbM family methyltransferase [Flavobacteriales bacterium]
MSFGRVLGMMRNVKNFPSYLFHKWGIAKQEPFVLQAKNDVSVEVPSRMMHTAKEVFFTDDYRFDQLKETILGLTATPTIVDVGANVGYLSAFSFTRFPKAKVISVEPIPNNLNLLRRNKQMNSQFDWTIFEGVLSDTDGELEIQFDNTDSFSTSASMYGLDAGNDKLNVRSLSLDSLMKERQLAQIHILKLDCEGAEYDILYCLNDKQLNSIRFITMETHHIDNERRNRDVLVSWLSGKGWNTDVVRSKVLAINPSFSQL